MIETRRNADNAKSASPEETRERILQAAREIIGRKGKRGATTREIADVAGVNEATIFRHFGTKEALIVAVGQHFCGVFELGELASQSTGNVADDLLAIGRAMLQRMDSQMDMIRWSLVEQEYEADLFATTAWRPQLAIHAVVVDYMTRQVEGGQIAGDPEKLAMFFLGHVFMHALARKKFPDSALYRCSDDDALRFYIDVFLNGVRSK
jgi:AcrR family transcriptional regulator